MAYTPKTWSDRAVGGTPITAADLNHIEQGIAAAGTGGGGGGITLADNGDGTFSLGGTAVVDNGNGTYTVTA